MSDGEYKGKLRAWAVDRAIQLSDVKDVDIVLVVANRLVDYVFEPEADFMDALARIQAYLKTAGAADALAKVDTMVAELGYLRNDIEAQANMSKEAA